MRDLKEGDIIYLREMKEVLTRSNREEGSQR